VEVARRVVGLGKGKGRRVRYGRGGGVFFVKIRETVTSLGFVIVVNDFKYSIITNRMLIIQMIILNCFYIYVIFFQCIHVSSFMIKLYNVHVHGMTIRLVQ
jgi:hypothetical protein